MTIAAITFAISRHFKQPICELCFVFQIFKNHMIYTYFLRVKVIWVEIEYEFVSLKKWSLKILRCGRISRSFFSLIAHLSIWVCLLKKKIIFISHDFYRLRKRKQRLPVDQSENSKNKATRTLATTQND